MKPVEDAAEFAVEEAELTGCWVHMVKARDLGQYGSIAALLKYYFYIYKSWHTGYRYPR